MPDYDLDFAYEIEGAEDARAKYNAWASTYDQSFAQAWGYIAPREIAGILNGTGAEGPVLDIGAGTGLVAEHLTGHVVDGIDIAPDMLDIARPKGLYRELIIGDLTQPLALKSGTYGAVISCGTFTHGHVGPECFPELLRVTRPGAQFVCGTIPAVFDQAGFGSELALMVARGLISPVSFVDIPIYEGADHEHAQDRGLVMVFTRV